MIGLFKKKKRDSDWINSYPVYDAPHVGVGRTLSELQARENLDYLLTNKSVRIDALSTVLQTFNIDLVAGFANESPGELISQLYNWSEEHTPREKWLGGFKANTGENFTTLEGIAASLGEEFTLTNEPTDIPFVLRETKRKFQLGVSELTIWQKSK